ncbi:MAG: glycosyltransferase family 2 protein [Porphyromonas sp.]|nr:glycosyltransferase family 2 protein [Porphyromonas sp.]
MTQVISNALPHTERALVSVIIPMYRVAAHLERCLAQLRAQTYQQLELIFVDDASPDDAYDYVSAHQAELEALGMQVRLLRHEQNKGVAAARNTALDAATGEYVYSFDADDAMEPNLIERLVVRAYQTGCDIVGCNWSLRYAGRDRAMAQPDVRTGEEMYAAMCYGVMKWNLWLFLVRRSLFDRGERLRFTPGDNMGEDMMMMSRLALRAERVSIVPEVLYYYVKTNETAQTASYRPEHWAQVDRNLRTLSESLEREGRGEALQLLHQLKLNLKLPLLISSNPEDYRRWQTWYPEANAYIMHNPRLSMRTKLLQLAAHRGQWWLVGLYNRIVGEWLYKLIYK